MLIVDDILFAPFKGLFWIFREIRNAAQQESANEVEALTCELSDLYMMLETDRISEAEFNAREKELLDRLDKLNDQGEQPDEEEDAEEEEV